jgi:cytidylate kinase
MDFRINKPQSKDRLRLVEDQFHMWEASGVRKESDEINRVKFVTISRQYGCAGFRVGDRLADVLNGMFPSTENAPPWTVYDRKLVETICQDHNLSSTLVKALNTQRKNLFAEMITGMFTGEPSSLKVFKNCARTIFHLAAAGRVILIGRAAAMVASKLTGGLHVRIIGSLDWRIKQVAEYEKIKSPAEARKYVLKQDGEREQFSRDFMGHSVSEPEFYDMILNQEKLGVERMVKLILRAMELKRIQTDEV